MEFMEVTHNSPAYEQAWVLRQRVLRSPLGLSLQPEERVAEREHLHFALVDVGDKVMACVSAVLLPQQVAKLRQMAVEPASQGGGLGRRLIQEVEKALISRGIQRIEMHARESAIGFYQNLGYASDGRQFIEVSIPHVKMYKNVP